MPRRRVPALERLYGRLGVEEIVVGDDALARGAEIGVGVEAGVEEGDGDAPPGVAGVGVQPVGDGEDSLAVGRGRNRSRGEMEARGTSSEQRTGLRAEREESRSLPGIMGLTDGRSLPASGVPG